jgi:Fe-S-cluster-containing dehydrogenase component
MYFGRLDQPDSVVSRLLRERSHKVLKPETGNEPHVYYLT